MKKILLSLVAIVAVTFGLTTVKAANVNVKDIDTNSYIIGYRVYELNNYDFSIYDVVIAATEYSNMNGGAAAPIYYLGEKEDETKFLDQITGPKGEDGKVPTNPEVSKVEDVYADGLINVTAINNSEVEDYAALDVEPKIVAAVEALDEVEELGFKGVTYDSENKEIVFEIEDTSMDLVNSKDVIVKLFENFVNELEEDVEITYEIDGAKGDLRALVNGDSKALVALAKTLLEGISTDGELTLASVVGKNLSAMLSFNKDGVITSEKYTVSFDLCDEAAINKAEEDLNENLEEAAQTLADSNLGFESATYDEELHLLELNVADREESLISSTSKVVELFNQYISELPEDVELEYSLNGEKYNLKDLDSDTLKTIARTLLSQVSTDGKFNLGSVLGKEITATLVYISGEVADNVTYTVKFNESDELVLNDTVQNTDSQISEFIETVDADLGFESVTYDEEAHKITFVAQEDADIDLKEVKDVALDLFDQFVSELPEDVNVTYTFEGVVYDLKTLSHSEAAELAAKVLSSNDAFDLNAVKGNLTADIVYELADGGKNTVTYTAVFE